MKCNCGGNMIFKTGIYGGFYGCSNFPRCKNSFSEKPPRKTPYKSDKEYEQAQRAVYTAMWCDNFS